MRPLFCGNLDFDARQSDVERIFRRYGRVERVDMKSGFAFIYMEDERDADDAIRRLDRTEFGRKGRRIRVEWTKQDRGNGRTDGSRRSNTRPSKTLFVINFDPVHTGTRDLERHFEPYGKILNVRIRRNFPFVQYELQEDATKALEATNMRYKPWSLVYLTLMPASLWIGPFQSNMQFEMMMMIKERVIALTEEVVIYPLGEEAMNVDVSPVRITGIGVALTMAMYPIQTLDLNEGEVPTMAEQKAQSTADTIVGCHHEEA